MAEITAGPLATGLVALVEGIAAAVTAQVGAASAGETAAVSGTAGFEEVVSC